MSVPLPGILVCHTTSLHSPSGSQVYIQGTEEIERKKNVGPLFSQDLSTGED